MPIWYMSGFVYVHFSNKVSTESMRAYIFPFPYSVNIKYPHISLLYILNCVGYMHYLIYINTRFYKKCNIFDLNEKDRKKIMFMHTLFATKTNLEGENK